MRDDLQLDLCDPILHNYMFSVDSYVLMISVLSNVWKCIVIFILVHDTRSNFYKLGVVTFTPWSHFCQRKSPWYPLDVKLGGLQSRSRCSVKEKNLFLLQGIESQFLNCLAHSLVAIPAELSQLLGMYQFHCVFSQSFMILNFVVKLKSLHFLCVVQQLCHSQVTLTQNNTYFLHFSCVG
jgi:hypothetical protein